MEGIVSAYRLSLYWIYFVLMTVFAVFCAFLAISKIKIVKWEFFYPKQQKWAKKHEQKLNIFIKRFFSSIKHCVLFDWFFAFLLRFTLCFN